METLETQELTTSKSKAPFHAFANKLRAHNCAREFCFSQIGRYKVKHSSTLASPEQSTTSFTRPKLNSVIQIGTARPFQFKVHITLIFKAPRESNNGIGFFATQSFYYRFLLHRHRCCAFNHAIDQLPHPEKQLSTLSTPYSAVSESSVALI